MKSILDDEVTYQMMLLVLKQTIDIILVLTCQFIFVPVQEKNPCRQS